MTKKNITAPELREKYFHFFQSKQHQLIPSASLIPSNDPSVLFTTAGMQPLVPFFLGEPHPVGKRLVNIQKCLRTVDVANIGDNTHHTFFQMLGNWSLGDYFKKEAIEWSFEFLTDKKWLHLPLKNLAVSVYQGDKNVPRDEESAHLWEKLGLPKKRIAFLGEDNFWSAGDTGPCGPSTEIFYWTGTEPAPPLFNPQDTRWVEIWNDVFMTYHRNPDHSLVPLRQKNVDTGMGFERTLAILTGQKSAYETDLFLPLINHLEELSNQTYTQKTKEMRLIADHLRAAVFILGDENAVLPSNTDRGYVLRRLIRRAVRYAKTIGIEKGCFSELAVTTIKIYGPFYLELIKNEQKILLELEKEEQKFLQTLEKGLQHFYKTVTNKSRITGQDAFLLFQSYGFPLEMTIELALEEGLQVDVPGFQQEFSKHQQTSRTAAQGLFKGGLADHSPQTIRLHTATHLLNEALRRVISCSIHQRGSNITPERLRFDFSFERKLTPEEIRTIEQEVNRIIKLSLSVRRETIPYQKALQLGAEMEFGQKYGDTVSVYFVGDYSTELCGGPHVSNTREIGRFKIIKEESCAAGVRRIKAIIE